MTTYTGIASNDGWTVVQAGTFTLNGAGGIDTLYLGTSTRAEYSVTNAADGSIHVDSISSASAPLHATLQNMEVLVYSSNHDYVGLGGLDVAFFDGSLSAAYKKASTNYTLSSNASGFQALAKDGTGLYTFSNIERIQFTDKSVAWDFANNGNASLVAKTLAAVFGASSLSNTSYVGIGLKFLDQDTHTASNAKFSDIMALALSVALPGASNAQVVDLLYTNVVGAHPTTAQAQPFVAMLDTGAQTASSLGVMAADLVNITAMGLPQSGLAYTGYTL
jgi:hypothetical protein